MACRLTLQFVGYSGAGFFPFRRRLFLSFPSFFFTLVCSYFVLIFFLSSLHFSLQCIIPWSLTLLTYSHPFLLFLSPSQTRLLSLPFLYGILFLLTLSPLPLPPCLSPSLYMVPACLPAPPSLHYQAGSRQPHTLFFASILSPPCCLGVGAAAVWSPQRSAKVTGGRHGLRSWQGIAPCAVFITNIL